jgi:hypothetical protein
MQRKGPLPVSHHLQADDAQPGGRLPSRPDLRASHAVTDATDRAGRRLPLLSPSARLALGVVLTAAALLVAALAAVL